MDGENAGNIEDETFSADKASIAIEGVSAHPGFAKGKMEMRSRSPRHRRAAAEKHLLARNHRGPKGFLHPTRSRATLERRTLDIIVRDFTEDGLKEKEILLENTVKDR